MDVIRAAAHDVERPIFYAIAVIIAGYLPIYVLSGPSGRLFQPMADTMSFALLGALLCTPHRAAGAVRVLPAQTRARTAGAAVRGGARGCMAGCWAGACATGWRR